MPEPKLYDVEQEYRYVEYFSVRAESKAEAMRVAKGEEPGAKYNTRRTRPAKHQLPQVKKVAE